MYLTHFCPDNIEKTQEKAGPNSALDFCKKAINGKCEIML